MRLPASVFTSFFIAFIAFSGCSTPPPHAERWGAGPSIRVCIADRAQEVSVGIGEGAVLQTVDTRYSLDGRRGLRFDLEADGGIQVTVDGTPARRFRGVARCYYRQGGSTFDIGGNVYSDTLLIASDGQSLYVINVLPLEEYLKSVVPREIGRNRKSDETEAVRAQAIIARTYALAKMRLPLTRLFDVYDDTRDQVFGGLNGRDAVASSAVEQTAGLVLTYGNSLAECYFHSTCGGRSEASSMVWQRPQSKPYLTGVVDRAIGPRGGFHGDGDYCRISPSYRWTEEYSREELESILRTFLPSANEAILPSDVPDAQWHLLDLKILRRGASGRVTMLKVVMGNRLQQRSYYLHGDKIRYGLRRSGGEQPLRSTLFDISLERNAARWIEHVRIDGGGNGHGVGLCQWGAIGMARAGRNAAEILAAYFPGTSVRPHD
jgi:stage II sporulation protein D